MKVYDIIAEASSMPTDPGEFVKATPAQWATMDKPAQMRYRRAESEWKQRKADFDRFQASRAQRIAQADALKAKKAAGPIANSRPGQWIAQRHAIWVKSNAAAAAAMEASWYGKAGTGLKYLFRFIGLSAPLYDLWIDLSGLESDFNEDIINKDQYEAEREFAFGAFEVQYLIPAIARALTNTDMILLVVRVIKNIVLGAGAVAGVATGGVVSGASIAAMVGTEAFITALQLWLGSDAGKHWLADSWFMPMIKFGGKIPDGLLDGLSKQVTNSSFYEKAEKEKSDYKNKKALDAAKTPAERTTAQQAIDKQKANAAAEKDSNDLLAQLK